MYVTYFDFIIDLSSDNRAQDSSFLGTRIFQTFSEAGISILPKNSLFIPFTYEIGEVVQVL